MPTGNAGENGKMDGLNLCGKQTERNDENM